MAFPGVPQFPAGLMLQSGDQLNAFVHNTLSVDINLRAHAGGGQQFATLVDAVVNVLSRVTTAGDSIQLPPTNGRFGFGPYLGGLQILIINSQANACQVFGNFFENSTIGGVSGSVGVSLAGGGSLSLVCGAPGVWVSIVGAGGAGALPINGGILSGFLGQTTASGLVGAGNSQSTATLINTQFAVVSSFPSGVPATGVRLPLTSDVGGTTGSITLLNKDPSNGGQVWPPAGGQINSSGTNNPIQISSGDRAEFFPDRTTPNQWWS